MRYETERHGLYRSRRGLLFGVCRGIAEYFDISVFWTRVVAAIAFLVSGIWPAAILYLLAAVLLKREPGAWTPAYAHRVAQWHGDAARACRRAADTLDARLHRLEAAMAADESAWDARLREER